MGLDQAATRLNTILWLILLAAAIGRSVLVIHDAAKSAPSYAIGYDRRQ
jgi:hypothetical protein